jgi:hypothetical protein|tara:strand:- start:392 stop:571 length:180 start_codon:yes stop_codon:yes gene_type:complete
MRLLILQKEKARLMRDRSPFGTPRWVIEEMVDGKWRSTKVYSKIWYKKERVIELNEGLQ